MNQDADPHATAPQRNEILLVDDDAATVELYSLVLSQMGHDVTAAASVAQAQACCERHPFDLVISDIRLCDGSGLQLMTYLQAHCRTRGIALSGLSMSEDVQLSLQAGFATHLTKPVDIDTFEKTVAAVLARPLN